MDEEVKTLIKVWISAIISISYCYYISSKIKSGIPRLLSVLPICALFLLLPLFLSSIHFVGSTALFFSGLANLKLLLFSFDQPPLSPLPSNLFLFICFACFPIKLQQNPKSLNRLPNWVLLFSIKVLIFGLVLNVYDYKQYLSPILLLCLHPLHIYLELEILLAFFQFLVTITLGFDLEPQFKEPYLATSLQDFWGHRWNLMVSAMLRSGVYTPVRRVCEIFMSYDSAMCVGVFSTFVVSGVGHEVLFFYITRQVPTGEVTLFFLLHGVCTAVEVAVKRTRFGRRWRMWPAVTRIVTVAFVCVTGDWLFFPQFIRSGVMENRAKETLFIFRFVKENISNYIM